MVEAKEDMHSLPIRSVHEALQLACQGKGHISCPTNCSLDLFETKEELEVHLKLACPNVIRSCTCCEINRPKMILTSDDFPCQQKFTQMSDTIKQF